MTVDFKDFDGAWESFLKISEMQNLTPGTTLFLKSVFRSGYAAGICNLMATIEDENQDAFNTVVDEVTKFSQALKQEVALHDARNSSEDPRSSH